MTLLKRLKRLTLAKMEEKIAEKVKEAIKTLYNAAIDTKLIQFQKTKKNFEGDITLVVFPILRLSKESPEKTAENIGTYLQQNVEEVTEFNVIKGFLNIIISSDYLAKLGNHKHYFL